MKFIIGKNENAIINLFLFLVISYLKIDKNNLGIVLIKNAIERKYMKSINNKIVIILLCGMSRWFTVYAKNEFNIDIKKNKMCT